MAFNQNQDTLRTLKLVIFLASIVFLFYFANVVTVLATNPNENIDSPVLLQRYYPSSYVLMIEDPVTGQVRAVPVPQGKVFDSQLNKLVDANTIDKSELDNSYYLPSDPLAGIRALIGFITFSILPFPFNIIPTFIVGVISSIIAYLVFGEIKSWLSVFTG
jgi:hypothetical protein